MLRKSRRRKDRGELPLRLMQPDHILISRLESPSVQRNMLRAIRQVTLSVVYSWLHEHERFFPA